MEQLGGYQIGDTSYSPSTNEKTVFFVNENGYDALRGAIGDDCDYYVKESKDHAESSMTTIMITAIVSIIAIVFIGLIITPILSKSVERQYQALSFFVMIPKEKIKVLLQNCQYCLNMGSDDKRFLEIQTNYEKFLGLKIVNQQVEQLRQDDLRKNEDEEDRVIGRQKNYLTFRA